MPRQLHKTRSIPWVVRLIWLQNACSCPLFSVAILTPKVGQTNLVFNMISSLLVGLCMQDYKSLCATATTCSSLVNIQTHINTHMQAAFWSAHMKSSASWVKTYPRENCTPGIIRAMWSVTAPCSTCTSSDRRLKQHWRVLMLFSRNSRWIALTMFGTCDFNWLTGLKINNKTHILISITVWI